jgi:hypothetical protein
MVGHQFPRVVAKGKVKEEKRGKELTPEMEEVKQAKEEIRRSDSD